MPAEFLCERIRSYGWKPSVTKLAQLASFIQSPGRSDEDIRRRTIDPILSITGDHRATQLIRHAQQFIARNRARIQIVHEEVVSYLQHLVIVESNDSEEAPSDPEISFWILGANCHLGEWAERDQRELSTEEKIIALQVRGHCFNQSSNWSARAVRCYETFRHCPEDSSLGGDEAWKRMQHETFGAPFEQYYQVILAPLLGIANRSDSRTPAIGLQYWKTTGVDLDWIKSRLDALALSREEARRQILAVENARDPQGLLHAPSLLRRKPLLFDQDGWLVTSPAAIATQFHTGAWGAYLERSKVTHGDRQGFLRWSSAFGIAFERYCASLATAASRSSQFRRNWRLILPSSIGSADEIEDIILVEDDHAVLFSVKSTLLPEGAVHRAKSQSAIIDWLDRFLFSEDRSFKGALRKLSANIDEIRNGEFEDQQVGRNLKLLPVLVTYDELGEDVFLYQYIRKRCRDLGILTQSSVAPVTIAAIDCFEWLMEYLRDGRSIVGLLKKRKHNRMWFDRRLDQQLNQIRPRIQSSYMSQEFQRIFGEVLRALQAGQEHSSKFPTE